eukprot:TRINITY_DN1439_c0_g2_i1.p1 TRINITY_DN1439_c0_g2~~TRINITY_DN1439_c0_g2_i1.p1  ORF type:complete len:619 (+),score=28.63 TRINITY_DN1439_c0_g2_i1:307-2163(+)
MAPFFSLLVIISLAALVNAKCKPGFEPIRESNVCTLCQPGFFGVGADSPCQRCPVDQIQPLAGQSKCIPCPDETPIAVNISTACIPVPPIGECPPGFEASPRSTGCFPCKPGTATLSPLTCEQCPPGTFQPLPEQNECLPCPEGTRANEDSTDCVDATGTCSAGFEFSTDVGFCIPCRPGNFGLGLGPCEPCPDGFPATIQPDEGQTSCTRCPLEAPYAIRSSTACSEFAEVPREPSETPDISEILESSDAPESSDTPDPSDTIGCQPGFEPIPESNVCTACQPGFFGVGGFSPCERCSQGDIQPFAGESECIPCPDEKPFAVNISTACVERPSSGNCPPGFQGVPIGCLPCEPGSASLLISSCVQCPPGTFQPLPEQNECLPCPEGTRANEDSTDCVDATGTCSAGFEFSTDVGFCIPCRPGFFGLGLRPCEPCPGGFPGTVQPNEEQTSCIPCPLQAPFAVDGATVCSEFQENSVECAPGSGQRPTEAECSVCAAGTFSTGGFGACEDCEFGNFQPLQGQTECVPCPPNSFTTFPADTCLCRFGFVRVTDENDATMLKCECVNGQVFLDEFGQSSCLECPENSSPNADGVCECLPGFFAVQQEDGDTFGFDFSCHC